MEEYISRNEHDEFCKRMEDEDNRQNRRLDILEANVLEMGQLTTTVAKLAMNMESMLKTQEQQDKRLGILEGRDGEMWRKVTGYAITAIISVVVGYIFAQINM